MTNADTCHCLIKHAITLLEVEAAIASLQRGRKVRDKVAITCAVVGLQPCPQTRRDKAAAAAANAALEEDWATYKNSV